MKKRICGVVGLLAGALLIAGCEQAKPPTAAGLKKIHARTARGGVNTKVEARSQPEIPLAGQVSIWDLKVFNKHDKPDGTRDEWKFFSPLPKSAASSNTTEVLMRAWLVSHDRNIFLPQKPSYKEYGSFVTDWIIPSAGDYTLWVEYIPSRATDGGIPTGTVLPQELLHWNFKATGDTHPGLTPTAPVAVQGEEKLPVLSLDGQNYGVATPNVFVQLKRPVFHAGQEAEFNWSVQGTAADQIEDADFAAISPDGQKFLHFPQTGDVSVTFPNTGVWRGWFSFRWNDQNYGVPVDFKVGK